MIILWSILSTVGLIVAAWYLSSIFNPYGRANYPMFLWKSIGHYISWLLIIVGVISLFGLYISTQDLILFSKILGGILILVLIVKIKITPMEMSFNDVMGSLYSGVGLRFGGFLTSEFLSATEPLEERRSGVRKEIVAEAHYLVFWLHMFPEITFFFGIVLYKSLWVALFLFALAFILEIIRFYFFGASPFLSRICRIWNWVKIPLFIIAAIIFWPEKNFLSIALIVFLVIQGWFDLIASLGMLPMRLMVGKIVYAKYGGNWHNMEGMAMNFVINRWRLKLFPADRFNVDQ